MSRYPHPPRDTITGPGHPCPGCEDPVPPLSGPPGDLHPERGPWNPEAVEVLAGDLSTYSTTRQGRVLVRVLDVLRGGPHFYGQGTSLVLCRVTGSGAARQGHAQGDLVDLAVLHLTLRTRKGDRR